jgi:aminoglycoside phosphotransferase (APT) family kinase protein
MATVELLNDPVAAARELAAFVRALRTVDPTDGPSHGRGSPVRRGDEILRGHVAELNGEVDAGALLAAWERVLDAPDHDGPPVWFHGDLSYLNVLARDGRVVSIIDWGTCAVGDPAIDTIVAWSLFDADGRAAYRAALGCSDAEWERGKGWVLQGVAGIPYYRDTNPVLVADKIRSIEAVLSESSLTDRRAPPASA